MKSLFSWGGQGQEAPVCGFNPEVPGLKSMERKRKLGESPTSARKQKVPSGQYLERIVKEAVEAAVQPLKEELAQIRKVLQEREQKGKKQEEESSRNSQQERVQEKVQKRVQGTSDKGKNKRKEIKPERGGVVQTYSQALQRDLPKITRKDEWKTVVGKKVKKRYPIEQRRLLFKLGGEQCQR